MIEWKEYKIGDIVSLEYGKSLLNYRNGIGDFDVFGTNGIIGTTNEILYDKPSVIIGRKGAYREVHLSKNPFFVIDTAFYTKNKLVDLDTLFLYYWFKNIDINAMDSGSAIPSTSRDEVYNVDINLPPLSEQIGISTILNCFDNNIELLHRQNKTLQLLTDNYYRKWFCDEEWAGSLSDYIKVQGGFAFKSKEFRETGFAGIIKITNISMGFVDISKCDHVDESIIKNLDKRFKIKSGDYLIAMTGAEIGKIGIVEKTEKEIWLNQRVGKLESKVPYGNIIGYMALKSRKGQDHIINTCSGSAQENISTTGIEEMNFASYNENKANSFGKEVKPFFEKIIINSNQIRILNQLRDNLLPKLMSGEVRVKL